MITWDQQSGPTRYRSKDRTYSVAEVYTADGVRFRAIFSGCLRATPIGEARETAEQAKADAEAFEAAL